MDLVLYKWPMPAPSTADAVELVAGASDGGRRLDDFVATALSIGRRAAVRLVERARVNGHRAQKGQRLRSGDVVCVPREEAPDPASVPRPEVVRMTSEVLVLAKPAGLPSVALRGAAGDSLAARIAAHFPECASVGGAGESGLVHRLDTGTSGLLLAARGDAAYASLRAQFRAHAVRKEYLALVAGELRAPLQLDTPIGQHHASKRRMRAVAHEDHDQRYASRPARTDVRPERLLTGATLVRATTSSGARHQIRVHLASAGHPLLGDPLYGDGALTRAGAVVGTGGFLLHACRIDWRDPATAEATSDELALPSTWDALLASLGTAASPPARAR